MTSTPISKLRRRRGVVRASITRLGARLTELEYTADQPRTRDHARQLLGKLRSLDEEFRRLHYELIDLIDEGSDDALEAEQATLDKHDDDVATLTVRVETLSMSTHHTSADHARPAVIPDPRKALSRRLSRVEAGLKRIRDVVGYYRRFRRALHIDAVPRGNDGLQKRPRRPVRRTHIQGCSRR